MEIISFSELEEMFDKKAVAAMDSNDQQWIDTLFPCSFSLVFDSITVWRGSSVVSLRGESGRVNIKRVKKIERCINNSIVTCLITAYDIVLGEKVFVIKFHNSENMC